MTYSESIGPHGAAPQGDDVESPACNLCGADAAKTLYTARDTRYQVDSFDWPVVQCTRCGLAYLNPRPSPGAIGKYYPSRFYVGRDSDASKRRYERQWRYLANLPRGRLLDVGCANGDWMKFVAEQGWEVAGVEPSETSANPHGLDIRRGRIPEALDHPAASFDAVTAWAVFEHLHDPAGAFSAVARLLRPGGTFVMLVTNIRSLFSRFAYLEDIPRHLYFFSDRTLAAYAEKAGFDLLRVDHDTELFGGSGRGALRVQTFKAIGLGVSEYYRFIGQSLAQRFQERPLVAALDTGLAAVERLIIRDRLVRALRISGIIVGVFRRR